MIEVKYFTNIQLKKYLNEIYKDQIDSKAILFPVERYIILEAGTIARCSVMLNAKHFHATFDVPIKVFNDLQTINTLELIAYEPRYQENRLK